MSQPRGSDETGAAQTALPVADQLPSAGASPSTHDHPAGDHLVGNQPRGDHPLGDQPLGDQPLDDQPGHRPTGYPGLSRGWDGHAWAPDAVAEPSVEAIRNRGHAVLRTRRFWFAALAVLVGAVLAGVAGARGHSMDWLAGLAGAIAVAGTLLGLSAAVWHRLRLRTAITASGWSLRAAVGLGLLAGVVALVLAYAVETWFDKTVGVGKIGLLFLAGPIEETAKLLIPVILFFTLRRRLADPRVGFAVVWVSATLFGYAEGIEYLLGLGKAEHLVRPSADRAAAEAVTGVMLLISRAFTELMHPLLTAGAAAAMWLGAWRGRRLLAGGGLIAYLTAIVLHSINDGAIGGLLNAALPSATLVVWPLWVVLIYQVFRIHTRELVPPSAIGSSPVRWRPRRPRVVEPQAAVDRTGVDRPGR